jgi:hypothetical protein
MRREPIYVLHFSGHAIRLNYPVDEPSVKSYGGQATTPFGNATLRPRLLGNAISVADGSSHKVYSLLWHKTYLLPSAPPHTRIESDADPTIYA